MKLRALAVLPLLFCASAAFADDTPVRDKWALIIGISKFKDQSLNLKYPAKDAKDFADFLVKNANFAPDHVRVLTDGQATRQRILDELGDKWLPHVAAPGDLVVIYLSSHGSPSDLDVAGVNYVVAHDTDKDHLYSTGIAMQELCGIVKERVHSDRALIIMDACHSGATTPGGKGMYRSSNVDAEAVAAGTGQMVICSSGPNQLSWEAKNAQNSVFTKRLIEGFRVKGDDTTIGDTFSYVKNKVEEDVLRERGQLQSPVFKSKWQGEGLRLSAKPAEPRAGLPPELPESASTPSAVVAAKPAAVVASPPTRSPQVNPAVAAGSTSGIAVPSARQQAEKALRDHFTRMAYSTPKEAYSDFTAAAQSLSPFARYEVNVRKQKYVAEVANMPDKAFKHVSATPTNAVIMVDEKYITGQPVYWRYRLVKQNGVWLIDGYNILKPEAWKSL